MTSRENSQRQTREKLIAAAVSAVARNGYDATSIGAIADAAGFTKGAFFSNFESKDGLLLEVMQRHYETECADLTQLIGGGHKDSAAVDRYVDQLVGNVEWCMLSVELALHASRNPAFAARYTPLRRNFAAALGGLIEQMFTETARGLPGTPEEIGSLVLAFVQGISLASASGTREPGASQSVNLFINGLLANGHPQKPERP